MVSFWPLRYVFWYHTKQWCHFQHLSNWKHMLLNLTELLAVIGNSKLQPSNAANKSWRRISAWAKAEKYVFYRYNSTKPVTTRLFSSMTKELHALRKTRFKIRNSAKITFLNSFDFIQINVNSFKSLCYLIFSCLCTKISFFRNM